jgi:Transport protein Avl9
MGYAGSEEFIRLQFEEYLLALLSSTSYHNRSGSPRPKAHMQAPSSHTPEEDPSFEFNSDFIHAWEQTANYALFVRLTSESPLFDIIEPKHPTAGGLSVEDVQRRLAQQVAELHLDERMREGRETLGKHLAMGKERVGQFSHKIWADIEALREAQRKRGMERSSGTGEESGSATAQVRQTDGAGSDEVDSNHIHGSQGYAWPTRTPAPDLAQIQASAKDVSAKAGAYLSSWGSWARDKGKGWQEKRSASSSTAQGPRATPMKLSTSAARPEKTRSTLSPTGSEHSGKGRLSGELAGDRFRRWSHLSKMDKEGHSTAGGEGSTQQASETAAAAAAAPGSRHAAGLGRKTPTLDTETTELGATTVGDDADEKG